MSASLIDCYWLGSGEPSYRKGGPI